MAITPKEKELTAVGISVAAGCKPCTDYHVKAVRKARASDEEIIQAVAEAVSVRKNATAIMEAHALAHLGEKGHAGESSPSDETNRVKELVCVGAAFGVNCVSSLEKHLAAAAAVGISQDEIKQIVELAAFIKGKAASHVERLVGMMEEKEEKEQVSGHQREVGSCS